jgi:anti-anti-sigma regulatory factor
MLCPPDGPKTIVVVAPDALDSQSARALQERVAVLLQRGQADVVTCDVGATTTAELATIDVLARLQLTARRLGRSIRLRHASGPLVDMIELTGLSSVLPCCPKTFRG